MTALRGRMQHEQLVELAAAAAEASSEAGDPAQPLAAAKEGDDEEPTTPNLPPDGAPDVLSQLAMLSSNVHPATTNSAEPAAKSTKKILSRKEPVNTANLLMSWPDGESESYDILPYFSFPRDEAAKKLGLCPTILKRICREHGLKVQRRSCCKRCRCPCCRSYC